MKFKDLPRESQLALSLGIAKERARLGKPSYFDRWWYFDTNCLSELVKLHSSGYEDKVAEFLSARDVLLSSTALEELRRAPNILASLEETLHSSNPYMVPDITRFWYSDIFNFLNEVDPIAFNSLDVFPLQQGFLPDFVGRNRKVFDEVCTESERSIENLFHFKVTPDIGADLDERDLCVYIWSVVTQNAQEWFDIEIPVADFRYSNFPSHFIHFYSYFFRYIKQPGIKVEINDFFDLAHCLVAPYCERLFCEAPFASILRQNIQSRNPPTALQLTKKLHKKGMISRSIYEDARTKRATFERTTPMLQNVMISTFTELREEIISINAS